MVPKYFPSGSMAVGSIRRWPLGASELAWRWARVGTPLGIVTMPPIKMVMTEGWFMKGILPTLMGNNGNMMWDTYLILIFIFLYI